MPMEISCIYPQYKAPSIGQGFGRLSCFLPIITPLMRRKVPVTKARPVKRAGPAQPAFGTTGTECKTAGSKPGRQDKSAWIYCGYFAAVGNGAGLSESEFR